MAYIHFTDEQKQRANSVDLVDFLQRQGEQLTRSGREWRWQRYDSVTVRGSQWFRHSRKEGGHAIDFIQEFYGLSFPEAVTLLLGGEFGVEWNQSSKSAPPARKAFALPEANSDMRRVFAYLIKQRFISPEVLSHFAHEKLLYEDKTYHNAIFVGLDERSIARHAHKRGTYTQGEPYKGNVEGSDPRYSFHWIGESATLYVFEAPVDMLSFITLHPEDWRKYSYVTLDGVSEHAMLRQLELNAHLKNVVLCLDHDEAGIEAIGRLQDILNEYGYNDPGHRQIGVWQPEFKDWNEDIKAMHGITPIPAREHPKLELLPQICSQLLDICKLHSLRSDPVPKLMEQCEKLMPLLAPELPTVQSTEFVNRQLQLTAGGALLALQNLYRQMETPAPLERVVAILQSEYKPHQDRGRMRSKAEDIRADIREVTRRSCAIGIRTLDEQKALQNSYLKLALDCVKAQMFLILERPSQSQKQELSGNFTMIM
ncbi:DUF3991 domain-containing protein [Desulfitobacterium hafniense]|uniref:DUF3991 domain-containing protein n=1 Tax=Desulfitobacterium hafniense (strain Y51) TaxID=138119 RepID=Q24NR6_DESHY|nr:DUF3991 domain-containing protein [Desulfitobacterium hafniense]BAE86326.1 hypothetical protein DSY4537 [Desulfitobacterium hafniense Y51]